MVSTSMFLQVISVMLIVYSPSISALPTTSSLYQPAARANSMSNSAPNIRSDSITWALEKRYTANAPSGKGAKPPGSNPNTGKNTASLPKAKPKPQAKFNAGANTPPGSGSTHPKSKIPIPVNNPNPPNYRSQMSTKRVTANQVKTPNGRISPSEKSQQKKPKDPARKPHPWDNPHTGNKTPIYAVSMGRMGYEEEADEGSENDDGQ